MIQRLRSREAPLGALGTTLLASAAIQVTLAVTGVILARALGPADRGRLALLVLIGALAFQFAALGLQFGLSFGVARVPGRAVEMLRNARKAIAVRAIVAPLLATAALAFLTVGEPGYMRAGALMVVALTAFSVIQECGLGVLQGLQRFNPLNVLRAVPSATFAAAAGVLVLVGEGGFMQLTAAWAGSNIVFVPLTVWRAQVVAAGLHDPGAAQPPTTAWIARFGRRSMLGAQPPIETFRPDQAVVALFLAPVSLGLYVVALAFTNLPRFIAQAVGMVATPLVASSETHARARRRMWQFFWAAIPFYLPPITALWIAAPQLTDFFFGSDFADAAAITRLLLIATALFSARRVLSDAARGAGYPLAGSVAEFVAFLAVLPSFAVFVPGLGTHGVAYALIAASAVALAVLIVMLLHPSALRATPSGWFESDKRDALPIREDQAAGV